VKLVPTGAQEADTAWKALIALEAVKAYDADVALLELNDWLAQDDDADEPGAHEALMAYDDVP
jgi:hypothetical protein